MSAGADSAFLARAGCGTILILILLSGCVWMCSLPPATDHQPAKPTRSAPAADPKTPDGHKIDVAEGKAFLKQIGNVSNPCDKAFHYTNLALSALNMQILYHNAEAGSEACQNAAEKIEDVPLPEHATDEAQAQMKSGVIDIYQVLADERGLMDRLKGFANSGEARPSDIESYQQDFAHTQAIKNDAVGKMVAALKSENALGDGSAVKHHRHRKAG